MTLSRQSIALVLTTKHKTPKNTQKQKKLTIKQINWPKKQNLNLNQQALIRL